MQIEAQAICEQFTGATQVNPGVENRAGESNGVVRAPVADTNARSADIFRGSKMPSFEG